MSTLLQPIDEKKHPPHMIFLRHASNVKSYIRVNGSYCKCNNGLCLQSEAKNVMCEDGTKIAMCKCKLCDASM